jgi:hypothetical protein
VCPNHINCRFYTKGIYKGVWGLACLDDLEGNAAGSVASGRVTAAGRLLEQTPNKQRHPVGDALASAWLK